MAKETSDMFCTECGTQLTEDALFCSNCGEKVRTFLHSSPKIEQKCESCGSIMQRDEDEEMLFCPYCGSKKIIEYSDKVKIEKIKSNTDVKKEEIQKDTTLGKIAYETEKEKYYLKLSNGFRWAVVFLCAAWLLYKMVARDLLGIDFIMIFIALRAFVFPKFHKNESKDSWKKFFKIATIVICIVCLPVFLFTGNLVGVGLVLCFMFLPIVASREKKEKKEEKKKEEIVKVDKRELISVPGSSFEYLNEDCEIVAAEFRSAGFQNINFVANRDLYFGWFTKTGAIEKILVNGKSNFNKKSKFDRNSDITIIYHELKKTTKGSS